ncbi:MAG: hypothetical protein KAG66_16355, partial [Methylococcales bacterium]|nr:hypothetical protein [Methylococcales bacterium]
MQKTRRFTFSIGLLGLFGVLAVFIFSTHLYVQAQAGAIEVQGATAVNIGTAISYQGGLNQGGNPANGSFNFEFRLYDAVTGGTQIGSTGIHNGVVVTNGIFTITDLDFGSGAFNGEARFLAITVDGTLLAPRQELTPVPYALALPGLWTQQNGISPNLIGGHSNNQVASGIVGATIGGGGSATDLNTVTADYGTVGGGQNNSVSGGHSTVGGGVDNSASGFGATIGGGDSNDVSQQGATVGGGQDNSASRGFATVGGGNENIASGETSTVGGGGDNTASGDYATVGGGESNVASGSIATVPGGSQNIAEGDASFAAGQRAHAQHDGSFVWGDNSTTLTV